MRRSFVLAATLPAFLALGLGMGAEAQTHVGKDAYQGLHWSVAAPPLSVVAGATSRLVVTTPLSLSGCWRRHNDWSPPPLSQFWLAAPRLPPSYPPGTV